MPVRAVRRDPHLWFLLAGLPGPVCRWILDGLEAARFDRATAIDAAETLEIGLYFNWAKSAVIGLVLGVPLAVVPDAWAHPLFGLIMWTPLYILVAGVAQLFLKRTAAGDHRPAADRPTVLAVLRWAPWIAAVAAAGLATAFP